MSNTNICDKNQKITNFTTKITKLMESKTLLKRPISPSSSSSSEREPKRQTIANNTDETNMPIDKPSSNDLHSLDSIEGNASLT